MHRFTQPVATLSKAIALFLVFCSFRCFYTNQKASTSLHTRPFEPKFNQGCSRFCVEFLQRQQRGFSLFCLLLYFLSAFLHLSASSCSEPLTGNICGVSQLMFKAAQWGDRLGCMRSLTKLWSVSVRLLCNHPAVHVSVAVKVCLP